MNSDAPARLRRGDDPAGNPAGAEFVSVRNSLYAGGHEDRIRELQAPRPSAGLYQLLLSWGVVAAATYIAIRWFWAIPLAIIAIASRQRALGNVLHDSSHGNLWRRPGRLARLCIAAPNFEDFDYYRRQHLLHHAYLGDKIRDVDYYDLPPERTAWRLYRTLLLQRSFWLSSLFGALKCPNANRRSILLCWAAFVAVLCVAFGPGVAAMCLGLWLLARGTAYHAIHAFTELADHVGLTPGTIVSFTRNSPKNLLSMLLHPHNDNYHLTHHLFPRVPLASLAEAHLLLLTVPGYAEGHICDGYFLGRYPVSRSLVNAKILTDNVDRSTPARKLTSIADGTVSDFEQSTIHE